MQVPGDYVEVLEEHREDDKRRAVLEDAVAWGSLFLCIGGIALAWYTEYWHGLAVAGVVSVGNAIRCYKEWEALCRT